MNRINLNDVKAKAKTIGKQVWDKTKDGAVKVIVFAEQHPIAATIIVGSVAKLGDCARSSIVTRRQVKERRASERTVWDPKTMMHVHLKRPLHADESQYLHECAMRGESRYEVLKRMKLVR